MPSVQKGFSAPPCPEYQPLPSDTAGALSVGDAGALACTYKANTLPLGT